MDRLLIRVFLQQALRQCDYALIAQEDMGILTVGEEDDFSVRLWYEIENFVGAVGKIANVFWGRNPRARQPLRDLIGLNKHSILRSKAMRQNFEHFDERIDEWWQHSLKTGDFGFVDEDDPSFTGHQLERWRLLRSYSFGTRIVWFGGRSYNIRDLAAEVQRIRPLIVAELEKDDAEALWKRPVPSVGVNDKPPRGRRSRAR